MSQNRFREGDKLYNDKDFESFYMTFLYPNKEVKWHKFCENHAFSKHDGYINVFKWRWVWLSHEKRKSFVKVYDQKEMMDKIKIMNKEKEDECGNDDDIGKVVIEI